MHPLVLSAALSILGPTGPVKWAFTTAPARDGFVAVEMTATVDEGWHLYATRLENDLGPVPTSIRFTPNETVQPVGGLEEPKPKEVFDPNFGMQVRYHSGSVVFVQHFKETGVGVPVLTGEVEFMVCNDRTCLPPKVVSFSLDLPKTEAKP
ncbi:MAG: hypothetical protein JNL43_08650 [Flavobacteriales bacterium]|nr:hypothetical protein [Flavobacteriales bacterium]